MKNYSWLLLFLVLFAYSSFSQDLSIMRVEFNDNKVLIHYNLTDSVAARFYAVRLYSSIDNYLNPLINVGGDVGFEVRPGLNKKIIWDPFAELGKSFNGKVALKLRARVFVPFVRFESLEEYKTIVRGRPYNVTWSGGTAQNILNFELYRGARKVAAFPNIANVGHHKLTLPASVKPGEGYRFKISDSKNSDEVAYTAEFRVRRRIPLAAKLASLALLPAAYWAYQSTLDDASLPGPPNPK